MVELWETIDAMEHRIALIEGKIAPEPTDTITMDSYKLYKLKHALIDVRRHQYYLKDAYKPTIHWLNVDKPKRQYIDWNTDTYYWMPLSQWKARIANNYFPHISSNLEDYETRQLPNSQEIEVKWVVRRHTFNWEDSAHVRAFIQLYWRLRELLHDKLDTVGKTLFFDFDFYRKQAHLTPIQEWMLDCRLAQLSTHEICILLPHHWHTSYTENHLSSILNTTIPTAIAQAATRRRMLLETPASEMKRCNHCGRLQPRNLLFFGRNNDRKDKFESTCKDCQRNERQGKGVQYKYESNTNQTTKMRKMQTRTT